MTKLYKCFNRRCDHKIETPGVRCGECAEIWANTLERVRAAYARQELVVEEAGVYEVEAEPVGS